jgi:hypothetical protein
MAVPPQLLAGAGGVALVSAVWLGQLSEVHGIPQRAAVAYIAAARASDCGVDWRDLAAIGWAETGHGTTGGRHLDEVTGRLTPEHRHYDVIDWGGGPMQFLDGTWDRYAVDFDGDGHADSQDIDDTAMAAANYLCASNWDEDRWTALKAYNGAGSYADKVQAYADQLPPDPGGDVPVAQVVAQPAVKGGRRTLAATLEAGWQGLWGLLDRAEESTNRGGTPTLGRLTGAAAELGDQLAPRADSSETPAPLPAQPAPADPAPATDAVVNVDGIDVHSSIADPLRTLIAAARRDGHTLTGHGWRSIDDQIRLRQENGCPDIYDAPASACRVPTARPGRSMHETGRAVDVTDTGNGEWAWLAANAATYGWELTVPGEPWHIEFTANLT